MSRPRHALDVEYEAHVEHPVRFVTHKNLDLTEIVTTMLRWARSASSCGAIPTPSKMVVLLTGVCSPHV